VGEYLAKIDEMAILARETNLSDNCGKASALGAKARISLPQQPARRIMKLYEFRSFHRMTRRSC
jgi:hypothetical protein